MEYIKDLDSLDFISSLNMSYKFEPSKRPFLKQQSSIDYKNRRTAYDDDDDSNKFRPLPSSLSKSIDYKNRIYIEAVKEEEKHGKCSVCGKEKKLIISLDCGCKYCNSCKDNYYQDDNKCFCPDKD